jgi:hypothetical protein
MNQLAEQAPETLQVQIPTLNIELGNTQFKVIPHPNDPDGKLLVLGPVLLNVLVPLSEDAANLVALELAKDRLVVAPASAMPKMAASLRNGKH